MKKIKAKSLGVHPFGHDSSVAMIDCNKKEIFGVSLERLTRKKHDYRFFLPIVEKLFEVEPGCKITFSSNEVSVEEIERYNQYFQYQSLRRSFPATQNKIELLWAALKSPIKLKRFLKARKFMRNYKFRENIPAFRKYVADCLHISESNIQFLDHHFTHACCAYYFAPPSFKDNCIVITLDGQGDGSFCKVFTIESGLPREQISSLNDSSIPLIYSICTDILGFHPSADEGKLEALACYGNPDFKNNSLYQMLSGAFYICHEGQICHKSTSEFPFENISENWVGIKKHLESTHVSLGDKDFSAGMQLFFEEFLLNYIIKIKQKFSATRVAFSGGGVANVKLNLRVFEEAGFEDIYLFPAMGDDGLALGAAAYQHALSGENIEWLRGVGMPYFGTSYSVDEVESYLTKAKSIKYTYLGDATVKSLAEDLASNKICALFQGRMEFGPRALGHRSILGNPRNNQARDLINLKFKRREWFQPFCPSILEEERARLFEKSYPNKHMTCAFRVKPDLAVELPAIVHVDNTARAQFVSKEDDLFYHQLLSEMKRINEYGVLLNTSFNIHGKTIVMTPGDAVDDFLACGIDALYIEGFKVERL